MKLRNKKTGVIIEPDRVAVIKNTKETSTASFNRIAANYYSLAELNEEWEDYKPKEPLIEDEKVRKAVRAWAEAESIPLDGTVSYNYDEYSLGWYHTSLEFSKHIQNLRDESEYTIAELCGEEEE